VVLSWIFLIVGLGFIVAAIAFAYRTQVFLSTCTTAQGRIVALKSVRSTRRHTITYAPVFRFNVPGTHFATVVSRTSSNPPSFNVGEWVTVRYPADHPEQAVIDSFGQLWLWDWGFGGFGALFCAVSLLPLILGRLRRPPDLESPSSDAGVGIARRR
jgi:hypothetical protein